MRLPLSLAATAVLAAAATAQPTIAPTDAKSPADEQKSFKLPPGFAAQLVSSEPDIGKPIQLAFDARGRLWVTTSRHYPFAADPAKATDKLYILSDFAPDGKARKVEVFANDLNIPIGILPLPDCKSCLVTSVGSIYKLTDTDGDGKADKREVILTGFGAKDTHGMMNSFVLLPDGWVYACHGFSNESSVTAKDGSTVKMTSGNTFRFRLDGSRVEPWTFGQVNPFGLTVDPYFNLYSADCHSRPITQLIRGGVYSSFGKPHDGLGFAPDMINHDHGSTALCGLAWYDADHFPAKYKDCMFLGNVVTNRINFDKIEFVGSTPKAVQQPDFLTSGDPWFRPTDIKLGPDGALYVADFYNKIIGHYEVDLKHPGRDKDRGRVWRIVYVGEDGKAKPPAMPGDLTKAPIQDLGRLLGSPNLAVRLLATHEGIRRGKHDARTLATAQMRESTAGLAHAVWVLHAVGFGREELKVYLNVHDPRTTTPMGFTSVHAARILFREDHEAASAYAHPLVMYTFNGKMSDRAKSELVRAAVESMIAHTPTDNVEFLIEVLVQLIRTCPPADTHLRHAARIALRNALRDANGWDAAAAAVKTPADAAVIADIALGVANTAASGYLVKQFAASKGEPRFCEHVGRYGDDPQAAAVVAALKGSPAAVVAGLQALARGVQARGAKLPPAATALAEDACGQGLGSPDAGTVQASADLAGSLRLTSLFDGLLKLAGRTDRPDGQRAAAFAAVLLIDSGRGVPAVSAVVADAAAPLPLREKAAAALAGSADPAARTALLAALSPAPARLAGAIAVGLVGSPAGAAALLDAVAAGKASARLLQDKAVATKLPGNLKGKAAELLKGLPSADARLAGVIRQRADTYANLKPDAESGRQVFSKNCAACHQIGGQGAKVGPQLDGIGVRGADRLCEDILDPNRNVDAAFRATTLSLADGRTLTGLLLREEGAVLVLADAAGKEVRVPAGEVDKRSSSPLSPMPANFDTALTEAEFAQLLAYLLSVRGR